MERLDKYSHKGVTNRSVPVDMSFTFQPLDRVPYGCKSGYKKGTGEVGRGH